ncbi:hypothetical protein A1O3_02548 [Capronia epimyces CBS 606.96]|uniref:Amine oxidase domain-containing protein n=1 Tax=Capronia epimyces CBS 606.96 TaxID=1182542 RepID=W9YJR5_9EURO|nr:uncharacterized protein A1O3_02548 [Capronia epimyces CBS 606.96]EXJ89481.1 hypothetical protein A1O3_02548 [Capronia epimyces CBS 606.96]
MNSLIRIQLVDAVVKDFPRDKIRLVCKITAVTLTEADAVRLTANGRDQEFDHVILATHANQALEILWLVTGIDEAEILIGRLIDAEEAGGMVVTELYHIISVPPKKSGNISEVCVIY